MPVSCVVCEARVLGGLRVGGAKVLSNWKVLSNCQRCSRLKSTATPRSCSIGCGVLATLGMLASRKSLPRPSQWFCSWCVWAMPSSSLAHVSPGPCGRVLCTAALRRHPRTSAPSAATRARSRGTSRSSCAWWTAGRRSSRCLATWNTTLPWTCSCLCAGAASLRRPWLATWARPSSRTCSASCWSRQRECWRRVGPPAVACSASSSARCLRKLSA